ncbi:uncharacterized protein IUM83_08169 [Phytophthora cinnamomi]|uniref:uncharacterized protein n=1 Tax=Phytophthora cinnamomi TaxID=4785 RepID=UPI00355940A4|nr:hypothetical protein IUM83_08169 [Phytophthora cinnamomi]
MSEYTVRTDGCSGGAVQETGPLELSSSAEDALVAVSEMGAVDAVYLAGVGDLVAGSFEQRRAGDLTETRSLDLRTDWAEPRAAAAAASVGSLEVDSAASAAVQESGPEVLGGLSDSTSSERVGDPS